MKLENDEVQELLLKYDAVGLNEVKTKQRVSCPRFVSYSDKCDSKNISYSHLCPFLKRNIDVSFTRNLGYLTL